MPTFSTLREAFGFFDATAVNPRWAWAAQNGDGSVVVLTMWSDQKSMIDGHTIYDVWARGDLEVWRKRPGNADRLRKLKHARDQCSGLFRVVHVEPIDGHAFTRKTKPRYRADAELVMQIEKLNEDTGEFYARSIRTV